MIIGTLRPEEARVFDACEGYHQFHAEETQEPYGSFEIFWDDGCPEDEDGEPRPAGWYWAAGFRGCVLDSDPVGPFGHSRDALRDADEWNPEFDGEDE